MQTSTETPDTRRGDIEEQVARLRMFRLPLIMAVAVLSVAVVQDSRARSRLASSEPDTGAAVTQSKTDLPLAQQPILEAVGPDELVVSGQPPLEVPDGANLAEVSPAVDPTIRPGQTDSERDSGERAGLPAAGADAPRVDLGGVHSRSSVPETVSPDETEVITESAVGQDSLAAESRPEETPDEKPVAGLAILNPADSGGSVHFLVDDQVHTLAPGEEFTSMDEAPHQVVFHRGGPFGRAEFHLERGDYAFSVTAKGWDLLPRSSADRSAQKAEQ